MYRASRQVADKYTGPTDIFDDSLHDDDGLRWLVRLGYFQPSVRLRPSANAFSLSLNTPPTRPTTMVMAAAHRILSAVSIPASGWRRSRRARSATSRVRRTTRPSVMRFNIGVTSPWGCGDCRYCRGFGF